MDYQEINIPLFGGKFMLSVAEGSDSQYPEVYVGLKTAGDNWYWHQDLAIIGQSYHYDDEHEGPVLEDDMMEILVFANAWQEDYTDKFLVDIYPDCEEE